MLKEKKISDDIVKKFSEDGVVCIRQAFDPHWLALVEAGVAKNIKSPSPYAGVLKLNDKDEGRFFDDYCNWQRIHEYSDFIYHSPAASITARLMRSKISIFYHEHLLIKWPGTLKATPWHHDQPYYPVTGHQNVSLWMPLDPISRRSSIQFIKGSHNWGRLFIPRKFATESNYVPEDQESTEEYKNFEDVPSIDDKSKDYEILSWAIEPGDVVAFHMRTLHGASGNHSLTTPRRALATRWLGDDARFTNRPWEISPPETGGLSPGQPMECDSFPLVWPG